MWTYIGVLGGIILILAVGLVLMAVQKPAVAGTEAPTTAMPWLETSAPLGVSASTATTGATQPTLPTTPAPATPSDAPMPTAAPTASGAAPKNLIFMLSDGMGPSYLTAARLVLNRTRLALDDALVGTSRTAATTSYVTDSAAGATAYACGHKSYNGAIAVVGTDMADAKSVATIVEAAQQRGMAIGIVSTARVTHATPASFSSHSYYRDYEDFIALQQSKGGIDLFLGGGAKFFDKSSRKDKRDLFAEMRASSYQVFRTVSSFRSYANSSADATLMSAKVIGLFTDSHMSYEIDRDNNVEPSLTEMTDFALRMLAMKGKDKGFFLMVEGGRIDHCGHANDAACLPPEVGAYDDAFARVARFQAADGRTLVVGSSDHETGGFTLALPNIYRWVPSALAVCKASMEATVRQLLTEEGDAQDVQTVLEKYGLFKLPSSKLAKYQLFVENGDSSGLTKQLANDLSAVAGVEWSTGGHTGVDVNLYTLGDVGVDAATLAANNLPLFRNGRLGGNLENSDVGVYMAVAMGLWDAMRSFTAGNLTSFDLSLNHTLVFRMGDGRKRYIHD